MGINQSIINIIRKKYDGDMKLGYDTEYSVSYPSLCKKCNKEESRFINFNKGYSNFCIKCEKEENEYKKRNSVKNKEYDIDKFLIHYEENKDFYNNNFDKKNVYLDFFQRYTGIYTLSSYIRKYFGSQNFQKWDYVCEKCSYITKIDYFNNRPLCGSHSCRNFRREQSLKKIEKNNLKWENRDKTKDYICKETGKEYFLNSIKSLNDFISDLKNLSIEYNDYMIKHHRDNLAFCTECGKQIIKKNHFPYVKYIKKFCCAQHYYDHCKKNPNYGGRGSQERREKQSRTVKRKIKNGEFTPCRNHYTSWGAVNSLTGKKYRSRWELIFHMAYPNMEYEKKRISYYDTEKQKERVYIIDFIDQVTGNLYEIKPSTEMASLNVNSKREEAVKYAKKNNVEYIFIDEEKIIECYEIIKDKELEKDIIECVNNLKKQVSKKQKLKVSKK